MERTLLKKLTSFRIYPSISILLPTHRTFPENDQDALLLKKLMREVESRLLAEFDKKKLNGLLSKLRKIIEAVDVRMNLDGLAIFVNREFEKVVRLPFPVRERIIIDETFATRDLIRAVNRGINYYVLSVSANFVRLFEAHRDSFNEVTERGFPFANPFPMGSNLEESTSQKEARLKEFFNIVNKTFIQIHQAHPMDLAIVGVEKNLSFFCGQSDLTQFMITCIEGNHDHTSAHDLGKIVWPHVKKRMADKRHELVRQLDRYVGQKKLVTGLEEVWRLAMQDRGELLVVEEDFHQSAKIHQGKNILFTEGQQAEPGVSDDIVDEITEKVISSGGRVVFVDNGSLLSKGRIALVLRY